MAVSIEDIKKLRDQSGVSMTSCKKALEEANGDMSLAIENLRKKGESKAMERAERTTSNGVVKVKVDGNKGALVALLCETDFVSRGDDFKALGDLLLEKAFNGALTNENEEVQEVKDAQLKMGENVKLGKVAVISSDVLGFYVHSNDKIGAIVALKGGDADLAKDLAMHASATNPKYLSSTDVDNALVSKEREIWTEQLKNEGKNEEIIEKILVGKEKKFREENAFLSQEFVKNPETKISDLLKDKNAEIVDFVVFSI
ncbi:MAG: translation elongation factor Ts [Candidatus Gracilibacteria bacterium]|jgi:elongation factor Ts|nr:translation elongation factor Ts [Candidatus Gracilibacteria bacterium]